MTLYTSFLGQGIVNNTNVTLGGPWPGKRVVITDVLIQDYNADSTFGVLFGSSDTTNAVGYNASIGTTSFEFHGQQALIDGDSLVAQTDGTAVAFRVTGWLLDIRD